MKPQEPFPGMRLILDSVSAEDVGLNPKTLQRRRKQPGKITLEELRGIIEYKTSQGDAPITLLREILRKDLTP